MSDCVLGAQNRERIVALERDVGEIKTDIRCIKERLLNRPPIWATVAITGLTAIVAALIARSL